MIIEKYKVYLYYFFFLSLAFCLKVSISSMGAFFHFLLDHDLSSIENWLHQNSWTIFMISRLGALLLTLLWLKMNLYPWPNFKIIFKSKAENVFLVFVCSSFLWIYFSFLGKPVFVSVNKGYWQEQFFSFIGTILFYYIDLFLIRFLFEITNTTQLSFKKASKFILIALFMMEFFVSMQDYYSMSPYVLFNLFMLYVFIGKDFSLLSDSFLFILLFVSPASVILGWDVNNGGEFSLFKLNDKISPLYLTCAGLSVGIYLYINRMKNWILPT
jgi:hypothetical protein